MNWFNRKLTAVLVAAAIGSIKLSYDIGYKLGEEKSQEIINSYIEKIHSLQSDLTIAQNNVKEVIVTEYKTKIKTIVKKEKEYVYQATNDVPAEFNLSSGWVYLHDVAATGGNANSTLSSNGASSGIKDNQGLAVVVENYGICHENAEKLKALQDFLVKSQNANNNLNMNLNK
jgi:hypothetical protein